MAIPRRSDAANLVRISLQPFGSNNTGRRLSLVYQRSAWATKYLDFEVVRSKDLGLQDAWNTKNFQFDSESFRTPLLQDVETTSSRGITGWGTPEEFLQLRVTRK